jgi:hypothetical protein
MKRITVGFLIVVGILTLAGWGTRIYFGRLGTERLDAVSAKLDAEEPGWRLDAILAQRQQQAPPKDQNAAEPILAIGDRLSHEKNKEWADWRRAEGFQDRDRSNHRLPPDWIKHLGDIRDHTARDREDARRLRTFTAGYYPLTIGDNPYTVLLPHIDKARQVLSLLEYDALLAAADNDPDAAIRSAHAALNVSGSIGDEPFLISQLVRMSCDNVAAQAALQALAWGEPRQGLAELQAAFAAEADVPWFLNGVRGERALLDRIFTGLASGKLTLDDFAVLGLQKPGPLDFAGFRLYKALIPEDHAAALRILSEYVAAARLPHHEQIAAFAKIKLPPRPPDDFRYIGTNLLLPASEKVADAGLRTRALLLAASCLTACERFRQSCGRWPASLDEIPTDILREVPCDPYDGRPLRFERLQDGITVYSVGPERPARTTQRPTELGPYTHHGIGWKLWDADQRGLPPKPPAGEVINKTLGSLIDDPGDPPEPIPPPREVKR